MGVTTDYRIGVFSDTHRNPQAVLPLISKLQNANVQALVLNGDIGEGFEHIAMTLDAAGKTGLPVYAQPGSHEDIASYVPVIDALGKKYPNIIDCLKNPVHKVNGQHLVFLPGSDWNAGGQFNLQAGEIPSGNYLQVQEGLMPLDAIQLNAYMRHPQAQQALLNVTNMNDLDKLVTDADHTVVFCHIPPRYGNIRTGVDMAYFAEKQDDKSVIPGVALEGMIRQQFGNVPQAQMQQIARSNGFEFKQENRGNPDLAAAYTRNGVKKAINGHFHESAHRAHDANSNPIVAGRFTDNLAYMASYADAGLAGIVVLKDNAISYEPVSLR